MSPSRDIYLADLAVDYAWTFLHQPYRWGGDDPILGFDCSGMVIRIMQSVGRYPEGHDTTAQGLFRYYDLRGFKTGMATKGTLVFFRPIGSDRITHVEICFDSKFSIGASGGGSHTLTKEDAAKQNAFVKLRPIEGRKGNPELLFVDPFARKES